MHVGKDQSTLPEVYEVFLGCRGQGHNRGTALWLASQARPSSQKVWLHLYRTQWSLTALAVEIFLISPALRKENITV